MRQNLARSLVVVAALAGILATSVGGATAPAAKGWQTLLAVRIDLVSPLGWASGRFWFVTESGQAVTVWSARVGSGKLTKLVSTAEGQNEWIPSSFIVGSSLVNCCVPQPAQTARVSSAAPLLASGKVGDWATLPGDPETATLNGITGPPALGTPGNWLVHAAVGAAGRMIYALNGTSCPPDGAPHQCTVNGGGYAYLAACCTTAGQPTDLTSLLTDKAKGGAADLSLGSDSHGRVWLAWLDSAGSRPGLSFKLVQLDPLTLAPLASHKLDHVLVYNATGTTASFALVCTDACRLVYQALLGTYSWDGTGGPSTLWLNNRRADTGGALVGVASIGGRLALGRYANKVPNAPDSGQRLTTLLGDTRGHNLRPVAGLDVPIELPDGPTHVFAGIGTPTSFLTPAGLVALALYTDDRVGGGSRLLAAVLRS